MLYFLNKNLIKIERFNAISTAISSHVAGSENMNDLGKIIFIADNVEPDKRNDIFKNIEAGKFKDLNECIREIIELKVKKSNKSERELNPMLLCTLEAIDEEER